MTDRCETNSSQTSVRLSAQWRANRKAKHKRERTLRSSTGDSLPMGLNHSIELINLSSNSPVLAVMGLPCAAMMTVPIAYPVTDAAHAKNRKKKII